jgi:dienelactone hydrolase
MKRNVAHWLILFCSLSLFSLKISGQTLTAQNVSITGNTSGFYEYLPKGYDPNSSKKYPLLVFFHGVGEGGLGGTDLPRLLNTGLPALINSGRFPISFNSGGQSYSFIVIMPQFHGGGGLVSDGDPILDYALSHYKVDESRIYLTGLSIGGGNVWQYAGSSVNAAKRLAAIVPICGAQPADATSTANMAKANLPVWATNNQGDPIVAPGITLAWVNGIINSVPTDAIPPKVSIFPVNSHDAWTQTYDPNYRENGLNVYEWMLQFTRGTTQSLLPVTLGSYAVSLNGSGQAVLDWTTVTEQNSKRFVLERSTDTKTFIAIDSIRAGNQPNGQHYSIIDPHPSSGNNYYRIRQLDFDGEYKYFSILKLAVRSSAAAGLTISPNPVISNFQVEWNSPDRGRVTATLSDMQGRQIRTWQFDKRTNGLNQSLNIGNLNTGHYNLRLVGETTNAVQQIIKQ